jgi:esterase/lipase/1-acyl-sn-glycerol-3-phosphate acyltransferase
MYDDKGYTIKGTYDFAVRTLALVESRLGLNIKVHGNDDDLLNKGQIFLFNHFARFETLIPHYIIHRETGAYCRSVADKSLFRAAKGLARFLSDVGAVPNDLPGLLPFLAAEILRGHKVVIFPEGAMIKDRRVVDNAGQVGIFSFKENIFRKHHRGGAVLAMILDICKHRIRDLFDNDDTIRIRQWMLTLGFDSKQQLLEQALKPTVIVPATITFYPIRADDNFLTKSAEFMFRNRKLPERLLEELAVEGNIVFRDTDMDIRLGAPIQPKRRWGWIDTQLMRRYFLSVNHLDDLFSLKEAADSVVEALLLKTITRESDRLRDHYMEAIYQGISVNLGHLAAVMISELMERGERHVSYETLHKGLYLALKLLQSDPSVHLHRSILWPDRYRGLPDGMTKDLLRFMATCTQAGLLEKNLTGYRFLDKLFAEHDFHRIRLENPLMVYANEVAPIKAVGEVVRQVLDKLTQPLNPIELGGLLFEDEVRSWSHNSTYFSSQRYQEINARETATRSARPYLLTHHQPAELAVLLIHGLLASPAELEDFGNKLHGLGYTVMGVRLAGHGTSPWDLEQRKWEEWLESAQRGYDILKLHARRVMVVGFSAGAALALIMASRKPDKLAGVASVAAPFSLQDKNTAFAPLLHGVNRLVSKVSGSSGVAPFRPNEPAYPDINYRSIPISAVHELLEMMGELRLCLSAITAPVTIIQGDQDSVVKPESATRIHDLLVNCPNKSLHWIAGGEHWLITGDVGNTHALLLRFIETVQSLSPVEETQT